MAYKNNPGAGGDTAETAKTFPLSVDMLPPGMAAEINPGDILEFKVVAAANESGTIEVEYNYGEEGEHMEEGKESMGGEKESESSWEDDFRKEMSPQNPNPSAY